MISNFTDFDIDDRLVKAISKLGWAAPSEIQKRAIPPALEGKDIIIRAKTGSGKTAAYLIPLIQKILKNKESNKPKTISVVLVPSKELCKQSYRNALDLTSYCSKLVSVVDLGNSTVQSSSSLISTADILISTPSKILAHINNKTINLKDFLDYLILDEADMMFSYGYEQDLKTITTLLPKIYQALLVSATISEDIKCLEALVLNKPVILKLEESHLPEKDKLNQFVIKCESSDKYLLIYALFKLNLVQGKTLIFVNSIDRCYRLKLFLEQFYIRTCVLNSELPQSSRIHIVDEFNRGVYDIVIATDEAVVINTNLSNINQNKEKTKKKKKAMKIKKDYAVARGIDFQDVDNVLNFDFPETGDAYIHRVGRTARGNNHGTALSFVASSEDQRHLMMVEEKLKTDIIAKENILKPYNFKIEEIEGLRYRVNDVISSVTRIKVKDARFKEIKSEILHSNKLKMYFEENPKDLRVLRHDKILKPTDQQPHMKDVPEYLVPSSLRHIMVKSKRKRKQSNIQHEKIKKKKTDPLKTFKYK
ncbi:probable ATP-dependent RNA helicase DDX56 [Hydra vulgaris]|uniref:RNA helicase n=1 Tax=Hydra vulgaris TaxID=6087 RepID=A0ABM4BCR6_HYDVU